MPPKELKKVTDTIWELPQTFKEGMLVPARIYATEKLIRDMDDGVFNQVTNVARLPGIINHAFCMPDGHWGYGFPIGGVAAFDLDKGIISPGGIGFDINCLAGDTYVLTDLGFTKKIKDFETDKPDLVSFNNKTQSEETSKIVAFMSRQAKNILKIKTKSGIEILATEDHPIFTPNGMVPAADVEKNTNVAVYTFAGVPYQQPSGKTFLTAEDIRKIELPFNKERVIKELGEKGLLPLSFDNPALPYIAKIAGYDIGDGTLICTDKAQFAALYGKKEDLEIIQKDLEKIGFKSYLHQRERNHSIDTKYGNVSFVYVENSLHVTSQSFVALLKALKIPSGNKVKQEYEVPGWILESPLWIKRLFLAAFFGAEMSSPKTLTGHGYNFYMPTVSMNKSDEHISNARAFLNQIVKILKEFNITATLSQEREEYISKKGEKRLRIRLLINQDSQNLMNLYSKIGFEYNRLKRFLGNATVLYLNLKEKILQEREKAAVISSDLYSKGMKIKEILSTLGNESVNKRFIERSVFEGRKSSARIAYSFKTFEQFLEGRSENLGTSGFLWDEIESKELVEFNDAVYDFTVSTESHNFVANCTLVSNCGMRMATTNLTIKEVRPKIKELVDILFKTVPAGVGSSGFVKLDKREFEAVTATGAKWALENGFAWEEDLENTEEYGCMKDADPSKVSDRAFKRGITQVGTLGSGNHYLEIQHASQIFDEETAKLFGVHSKDQIVIMFHCGSRGFGHQIGTDYLKTFLDVMPKYGLKIWDPELACAPFQSKEGQDYYKAMCCGVNMSFANRQVILHRIREAFSKVFKKPAEELGMHQVYDVSHNTAKIEEHEVNGQRKKVLVHRKGSTRAFGPGREEVTAKYRHAGQPIIIGGSMETGSYLMVGTKKAELETFGSTCHGSGRTMSRTAAKRQFRGDTLIRDMEKRGIYVRTVSFAGVAEEAGAAYKDINEVIETVHQAGISKKVVALTPLGNVKG
ncbi:MAG: intein-containing RctB family protein [Candidatus Aenigmarchaeota archaeon]|nr:intein-containing RctB family protein [Candidatus Aenigmarchaeota archaeon]